MVNGQTTNGRKVKAHAAVTRLFLGAGCLALGCLVSGAFAALLSGAPAEAAPLPRESPTRGAERDASGTIWGADEEDDKVLQRWVGKSWQKTGFLPHPNAHVIGIAKRGDGGVIVLWHQTDEHGNVTADYFLSSHRGTVSQVVNHFHLPRPAAVGAAPAAVKPYWLLQSFVAPANSIWAVGEGRDFYHVSEAGETRKFFVLPDAALQKAQPKAGQSPPDPDARPSFDSLVEPNGRTWFWNNIWKNSDTIPRLSGFLTIEPDSPVKNTSTQIASTQTARKINFTLRRTFVGLPASPLPPVQALTRGGANRLFLSLRGAGVFEIRTDSMRATSVAEPFRGAFDVVRQLWVSGEDNDGDLYVVAGSRTSDNDKTIDATDDDYTLRRNSLWRRRAGKWKLLIAGMDKYAYDEIQDSRSFLQTPEGLWLGANSDGLWFIGRDDRAHSVSWQRGFDLAKSQTLFPLSSPKNATSAMFLATGLDGTTVVPGFAPLSHATAAANVSTFWAYIDPVQDARLHLWGVLNLRDHALHEWDGEHWIKHRAPANYKLSNGFEMALDAKGRVWIPSDTRERQSAIFDPRSEKWQIFPTYAAALLANRSGELPIANRNPEQERRGPWSVPRRGPAGRLCYLGAKRKIYLFNGEVWQSWKRADIEKDSNAEEFGNPPFFGSRGQLCVQFDENVYELTATGWHLTKREKDPDFRARHFDPTDLNRRGIDGLPPIPGEQSETNNPWSSTDWSNGIIDGEGTFWLLKNRVLYRAPRAPFPRVARLLLSDHQNQPLLDGRVLTSVLIDARGNAFFGTDHNEWVMLRANAPLPNTSVQLQREGSGSFIAYLRGFEAKSRSVNLLKKNPGAKKEVAWQFDGWFLWRLDGRIWSEPTRRNDLALDSLSPGHHVIEVLALSAEGRPDPTPARLAWNVIADTPEQLQELVGQLHSPNFAQREAAVRALSRQKNTSLPVLQAALETARQKDQANPQSEADTIWWLQVAIQETQGTP